MTEQDWRRQEKVSEKVARQILGEIANGRRSEGDSLPSEAEMLERFQVGRASLREALRILEIQGLIRIKAGPGGGPVVVGSRSSDVGRMATLHFQYIGSTFRELLDARLVMEPMMAGLAAKRQVPEYLEPLRRILDEGDSAEVDETSYRNATSDFHLLVAGMSGNRIMDLLGRALRDIYVQRLRDVTYPEEERSHVIAAHREIAQAILEGDAALAERLMREHMEDFALWVQQRFPGMMDGVIEWR